MKLASLEDAYIATLKDLVSTERQIVPALEKMCEAATDEKLREAFAEHKAETSSQLGRLEELFTGQGKSSRGRKCKGIEGILADGEAFIAGKGDDSARDVAMICAARRVEHFEITSYRAAVDLAHHLGREDELKILKEILQEEQTTDTKLAEILSGLINPESATQRPSSETEAKPRSSQQDERTDTMRHDYDDRYNDRERGGYEGRSQGGHRSSPMQGRDEYGQFAGNRGGGGGPYEDDNRGGGGQRYSSGGGSRGYSDDDTGRGGYEGRSYGGQRSSEMQERDQYGQFAGYRGGNSGNGGGGGRYDDDNRGGGGGQRYSSGGGSRGYSDDDTGRGGYEGRSYGGQRSSQMQDRDQYGQFTGNSGGNSGGGRYDSNDENRGGSQRYSSGGGSQRGGYNDDDRGGSRSRGGDYTDSAGRHYTQESWERAQEGRSRGGQHSHDGGGRNR